MSCIQDVGSMCRDTWEDRRRCNGSAQRAVRRPRRTLDGAQSSCSFMSTTLVLEPLPSPVQSISSPPKEFHLAGEESQRFRIRVPATQLVNIALQPRRVAWLLVKRWSTQLAGANDLTTITLRLDRHGTESITQHEFEDLHRRPSPASRHM